MLEIDSVSIKYDSRDILSGCYLNLEQGEVIGLLGRNGTGKSTLLKIIFGSVKADFMHMRLHGKICSSGYRNRDIAYLPQQPFIPGILRIADITKKLSPELRNDSTLSYFDRLNNIRLNEMSRGELKFLECLWVMSLPAKYILLDEPFSGISPIQIALIQEAIKTVSKQKGILLTDHLYNPLIEISDRILLLHNNAIYPIDSEEELIRYHYIPDRK